MRKKECDIKIISAGLESCLYLAKALTALGERPRVRGRWPEIVLGLAGGAALLTLALFLLLFVFFLRDYDRVSEWEGQTVVAEYRGIDRGSHQCPRVCRYESWLLRGEELGPGR